MMKWIARLSTAVLTLLVLARAAAAQDYAAPPSPTAYPPAYGCCSGDQAPPAQPPRVYVPGYGPGQVQPSPGMGTPCCASAPGGGYGPPQTDGRPRIYVEDMYGQWHEATGEEYARVYAYAQSRGTPQSGAQYVTVPGLCCGQTPPAPPPSYEPPPYSPPPYSPPPYSPPPPSCGGCCAPSYPPAPPTCPPSYPPGYGEVHLGDGFFYGSGGVGPEVVYSGGGGGGYGYAGAGASASSWASASASARVSVGGRGYRPPPHRPPHRPPPKKGGCGCH